MLKWKATAAGLGSSTSYLLAMSVRLCRRLWVERERQDQIGIGLCHDASIPLASVATGWKLLRPLEPKWNLRGSRPRVKPRNE